MTVLIAAGETVFLLPFAVARVFRPTFLEVFQITNLQLGTAFALYGFVAMISYFLGGPIADRFSARKLMATALVATSFGGVIFVTVPFITRTHFAIWILGINYNSVILGGVKFEQPENWEGYRHKVVPMEF